jgi:hypothetical protein
MATIVTVHGTFAHFDEAADPAAGDLQWWQPGSAFMTDVGTLLESRTADGRRAPVAIEPFVWSGFNSETDRRAAGLKLLDQLKVLEARNEPYVVVGHSHGGSVIEVALMESQRQRLSLDHMKRWVTVGTPFVQMRPKYWLVDRLNLWQRVVLVASMMLLIMFLVHVVGQLFSGGVGVVTTGRANPSTTGLNIGLYGWRTALAALMMSVPTLLFTFVFRIVDHRKLYFYRKANIERSRAAFEKKWVPLVHQDDEAVQGLRSLPRAKIQLFAPGFAQQALTTVAVFALPVAYLLVVTSQPIMLGIAGFLKNNVYQVDESGGRVRSANNDAGQQAEWGRIREMREKLKKDYPNYVGIERSIRYSREFLEENGQPCASKVLCGNGQSFAVNSRLLYHIVTDDVTAAVINDDTRFGIWSAALRAAIPLVLVPLAFILMALGLTWVIGMLAKWLSVLLARVLNKVTLTEIKREIYGNDTDGEVAIGGGPRPSWLTASAPYLPPEVATRITDYANTATSASLAKFRNALSTIAMSEGRPPESGVVSNYLSWKELIHTTYFELPEFRRLFARSISDADGFAASPAFEAGADYARATGWLGQISTQAAPGGNVVEPPAARAFAAAQ